MNCVSCLMLLWIGTLTTLSAGSWAEHRQEGRKHGWVETGERNQTEMLHASRKAVDFRAHNILKRCMYRICKHPLFPLFAHKGGRKKLKLKHPGPHSHGVSFCTFCRDFINIGSGQVFPWRFGLWKNQTYKLFLLLPHK